MNAHTPGPWWVTLHGKAAYVRMTIGKDGLPPSATGDAEFSVQPYIRPDEAYANARLIAAAPTLLNMVKWCVKNEGECLGDHTALLEAARGAIAELES